MAHQMDDSVSGTISRVSTESGTSVEPVSRSSATAQTVVWDKFNNSIFAKIANNDKFQNTTLGVIVVNALWISVDTEWNHNILVKEDGTYPLMPWSTIVENTFCGYFSMEVFFRFMAFKEKRHCIYDAWFVFDTILVTFMVLETWLLPLVELLSGSSGGGGLSSLSALRLLRLLRLTRMARLMRFVPELMILIKGIMQATVAVGFILLFLVMVMYVFAIIFTSVFGDPDFDADDPECDGCAKYIFGSLGDSMMTLFTNGVLGDNLNQTVDSIMAESLLMFWVFFLFFCISSMTLLNMLIGVLCEVIGGTAASEKNTMQEDAIRFCIEHAFLQIDQNADGKISKSEWHAIKENPLLRDTFIEAGWEADELDEQLENIETVLFQRRAGHKHLPTLELADLCGKIIEVCPGKAASLLDLKRVEAQQGTKHEKVKQELMEVEELFKELMNEKGLALPQLDSTISGRINVDDPAGPGTGGSPSLKGVTTQQLLQALKGKTPSFLPAAPGPAPVPRQSSGAVAQNNAPPPGGPRMGRSNSSRATRRSHSSPKTKRDPNAPDLSAVAHQEVPNVTSKVVMLQKPAPPPFGSLFDDNEVEELSVASPDQNSRIVLAENDLSIPGSCNQDPPADVFNMSGVSFHKDFEDAPARANNAMLSAIDPSSTLKSTGSTHTVRIDEGRNTMEDIVALPGSSPGGSKRHRHTGGEVPWVARRPPSQGAMSSTALALARRSGKIQVEDAEEAKERTCEEGLIDCQLDVAPRNHPLFQQLWRRPVPGGWMAARCVAAQLEAAPLTLPELSKRSRIRPESQLADILHSMPELFDMSEAPAMVDIQFPEVHLSGCPQDREEDYDDEHDDQSHKRLERCHCVWRICDALQTAEFDNGNTSSVQIPGMCSNNVESQMSGSLWGTVMSPGLPPRSKADIMDNFSSSLTGKSGRKRPVNAFQ